VLLAVCVGTGCKSEPPTVEPLPPGATGSPLPEEPTPLPTSGAGDAGCPGYDDVCVKQSPDMSARTVYQCLGTNVFRMDATLSSDPADDLEFPLERYFSFQSKSLENDHVLACCADEYLTGCGPLPSPQRSYCYLDCAQQSCIRGLYELEVLIANAPLSFGNTTKTELKELHNHLNLHLVECEEAIYRREDCFSMWLAEFAPDNVFQPYAPDPDAWCSVPAIHRGRYNVTNSKLWSGIKGLSISAECEVNDWIRLDPETFECKDNYGNNWAPFGDELFDPFNPIDPILPMSLEPPTATSAPSIPPPYMWPLPASLPWDAEK
jgi:hypothetical protein